MSKHRSFKLDKFITAVDNTLLKTYFTKKEVTIPTLLDADNLENLLDTIEAENKEKRLDIEEELQCINDIADNSRECLQDAITEFNIETNDADSPETVAMKVFLHPDKDAFSLAYDSYLYILYYEKLSHHQFTKGTLNFSDPKIKDFENEIALYLKNSGKSETCFTRKRLNGDKNILFIARGDFVKTHQIFDRDKIKVQSFRPAMEDMLIFDKKNSVLSLNMAGKNDVEKIKYIETFGKHILGLEKIDEDTINKTLVSLEPIKNNTFNYSGNDDIEVIKLTGVRVIQKGAGPIRLTIASPDITKLFDRFHLSAEGTEFLSAKLRFALKREGKKSKKIPVEIKPPEKTKLKGRKESKIIEDYLRENGVLLT